MVMYVDNMHISGGQAVTKALHFDSKNSIFFLGAQLCNLTYITFFCLGIFRSNSHVTETMGKNGL